MSTEILNMGLSTIRRITDMWAGAKADSLIDYTRVSRVEPIVLIDADCLYLTEILPQVQQSLLSQFAGYYLQAAALSLTVGKIDVKRHLDKLHPNRNPVDSAVDTAGWLLAAEAYKDKLPTPNDFAIALEAGKKEEIASTVGFGKDTGSTLKELANLSVGMQLMVDISDGQNKGTIPIQVRLMASSMPSTNLIHILSLGSQDNSMKERYHAWRAGRLEFIKDLCFCQDLIDAHRDNLMKDKDGIYTNLMARRRGNQISTLVSGNPSVATASNLVIMSTNTARELEVAVNGKLTDFKTREKIFRTGYLMILAIVDQEWNRVTFYYRGVAHANDLSVSDLKSSNKGDGPSVSDIMRAYQMGASPSL